MRLEEKVLIDAPARDVWELVANPAAYPRFMHGITRWEQAGDKEMGAGARYQMRMKVGSAEVGGLIEIVEFDEPCDLAWTNVTGVDQRGRWRVRERDGGTEVTLRLSYQAPGVLGMASDLFSARMVRDNLRQSLRGLKRRLEGGLIDGDGGGVGLTTSVVNRLHVAGTLTRAGVIRPGRPDRIIRTLLNLSRWGPTPAAGYASAAVRFPNDEAIIDELGTLTFEAVHRRTNALAHALSDAGVLEGDNVAVMCRNHRYFIEATVALSKLGANALFMNTAFAKPQLTEVAQREKPVAIIYDQEFGELLEDASRRRKRFIAWYDETDGPIGDPTLEELIEQGDPEEVVPPESPGRAVILTSGTTGTPKGASRSQPETVDPAAALLSRIPLRARERTMIAAPLFHSWGFAHFSLGLVLSSTLVLRRKFDPEQTLAVTSQYRCTALPLVPVMLQRIMELPEETRRKYDLSDLRVVPLSGSALHGELAERFMDEFGDVVYNLYGSTEVAWATIAGPEDLRAAPGTAGRPPRGTIVKLYDEEGVEVPPGETGRIFVGNEMLFEGYTGGGSKDEIDGLMATGDVGRFDEAGRLFVEGRDDEMIVSGGENVFPREIEDLLAKHKAVGEVAIIGVEDEEFGQRLKAFVVKKAGGELTEDQVKSYVKSNLARYKVPRDVEFMDELPRNATGKVLKRELEAREEEKKAKA
jgi:acyl-CoA synthetase (AMP-forming)/AMP-acid ligase II/carbon monoxide dehydrogenase subunit G